MEQVLYTLCISVSYFKLQFLIIIGRIINVIFCDFQVIKTIFFRVQNLENLQENPLHSYSERISRKVEKTLCINSYFVPL